MRLDIAALLLLIGACSSKDEDGDSGTDSDSGVDQGDSGSDGADGGDGAGGDSGGTDSGGTDSGGTDSGGTDAVPEVHDVDVDTLAAWLTKRLRAPASCC